MEDVARLPGTSAGGGHAGSWIDPACEVGADVDVERPPLHRYTRSERDLDRPDAAAQIPSPPGDFNFGGADLRALACSGGTKVELGGTFDPGRKARWPPDKSRARPDPLPTLRFVPPNTLSSSYGNCAVRLRRPSGALREWLSSGRAHDEGTMQLDGRTVRRIRIDPPSYCPVSSCPRKPNYAYVDPETFYPLQIRVRGLRSHRPTR